MDFKVETWPVDKLIPYARNPRKNDAVVEKMAAAIKEFGFRIPIVARSDGEIVDGHLRLKAAQKLGLKEVPVALADELTDTQVKAFRLLANKSANWAEWDDELLKLELEDLKGLDFDLELTGFELLEIGDLLADNDMTDPADPDEAPPLEEKAISNNGDVWILGRHRLMCADSTDASSVETLLRGSRADMVFTDPPYGVNVAGGRTSSNKHMRIAGDLNQTVIPFAFEVAVNVATKSDGRIYFCGCKGNLAMYGKLFERFLCQLPKHLVWVKNNFVIKQNGYHKIIYYGFKQGGGGRKTWFGERTGGAAWLGQEVAAHARNWLSANGSSYKTGFSHAERRVMRRRKPVPVSIWAEKHRILQGGAIPGKWKNLFTPYLAGIMDAAASPGVETVIICKSPQTGGSEAGHNFVGWCVDRCPGAVMYVFPDEITARENARDRIIPMLRGSPRLSRYMTGIGDDASSLRINLVHMPIYMGWSGSVSRLGNKPIRTLVLDELDKYQNPKNEATSEVLAEKRTTTWRRRRHILKISTPTTESGPIWQAYTTEAQARFAYWVRCPHCEAWQLMDFERIAWPGKDAEKAADPGIVLARRLAFYPCASCGAVWDDNDRNLAARAGQWRERESGMELFAYLAAHKPVKIGFHIPAWLSYFVSLSEIATCALRYRQSGRMEDLRELANQYKAEPWQPEETERSDAAILCLCDDRPPGVVPASKPIFCLLAGVDTQGANDQTGYFPYVIRAFGYGPSEESWLVKCGIARNIATLNALLWQTAYKTPEGVEHRVRACMIDAMGARTREIYAWAILHRGQVYPWQGKRSMAQPYAASPQEFFPDSNGRKIRIPGGLNLWQCDTTFFKSDLAAKLARAADEEGTFHLHSNTGGELDDYAAQMAVEIWDDAQMAWTNPKRRPNHFWDCEVMCLALAYILDVRFARQDASPAPPIAEKFVERRQNRPLSIAERLGRLSR